MMPSANPTPHPLDAAARDFTPISADEAQSFLAHARKDFTSEDNELGYVPVQPCDLERLSLTILALLAAVRGAEADTARLDWMQEHAADVEAVMDMDPEAEVGFRVRCYDTLDMGEGDTLRAAIDAARSATPTEGDDR